MIWQAVDGDLPVARETILLGLPMHGRMVMFLLRMISLRIQNTFPDVCKTGPTHYVRVFPSGIIEMQDLAKINGALFSLVSCIYLL
jgi:hypothetical protein